MKTYRKLSLKSLLLYAVSFVGGVIVGWWVKPKHMLEKKDVELLRDYVMKNIRQLQRRLEEYIAESTNPIPKKEELHTRPDISGSYKDVAGTYKDVAGTYKDTTDSYKLDVNWGNLEWINHDSGMGNKASCEEDTQPIRTRYTVEQIMPKR